MNRRDVLKFIGAGLAEVLTRRVKQKDIRIFNDPNYEYGINGKPVEVLCRSIDRPNLMWIHYDGPEEDLYWMYPCYFCETSRDGNTLFYLKGIATNLERVQLDRYMRVEEKWLK